MSMAAAKIAHRNRQAQRVPTSGAVAQGGPVAAMQAELDRHFPVACAEWQIAAEPQRALRLAAHLPSLMAGLSGAAVAAAAVAALFA